MSAVIISGVILLQFLSHSSGESTPVIQTASGPVQGVILQTVWHSTKYSAFKGIRYAEPPVGPQRFKPPIKAKPWTTILQAIEDGGKCIQPDIGTNSTTGSEDCLFLNVFTREVKFEDHMKFRPVMVWIHGGGYLSGSSDASVYGPDFFLEDDVVVVTVNYRLGAFGFLSLNHPHALGNCGLKDQLLALKWVQTNIAYFGGDPREVTIFGESAGAASVGFHVISEKSKGLFNKTASFSGTPLNLWAFSAPSEAVRSAFDLGNALGFQTKDKEDLLNFLLNASAADILNASTRMQLKKMQFQLDFVFKPTTENPKLASPEDVFLSECPVKLYQKGDFSHMPHLLGYVKDEVLSFSQPVVQLMQLKDYTENSVKLVSKQTPIGLDTTLFMNQLIEQLAKATFKEVIKILTNIVFVAPIDLTQRLLFAGNNKNPVYYYVVSYETEFALHKLFGVPMNGTGHADDVGYMWNVQKLQAPTDSQHPLNQFRKKFVRLLTNFAKYGNPTPNGTKDELLNVDWKDSGWLGMQLDIDEKFVLKTRMMDYNTRVYEILLYNALPLISQCRTILTDIFDFIL